MSQNNIEVWVVEVTTPSPTSVTPGRRNPEIFWCKTKAEADAKVTVLEGEGKSSKISKWQAILVWSMDFPEIEWIEV